VTYAYVGSWASFTDAPAEGIYAYRLDGETGALEHLQTVPLPDASFLAASAARSRLYAVTHSSYFEGEPGAGLVAYAVDGSTGELTRLGHRVVPLPHPPHVSLDRSERFLLVAAGLGGGIAVVRLADDGSLGDVTDVVRFPGEPSVPLGQRVTLPIHPRPGAPYPHSIQIDRGNRFVLVGDMGASRVAVFRLDPERGTLAAAGEPWAASPPGAPTDRPYGARHLDFHPDNRTVYVSNERDSSVSVFDLDSDVGTLRHLQTVRTLPDGFAGANSLAEITVHPSGRTVYVSNRGHDSIAVFAIDPQERTLRLLECEPTQGRHPRGFGLSPDGRLLLAANTETSTVVAFAIDADSGELEPTGAVTAVPAPTCVTFV
jgi:6-phosphogluconolactonase